jgi:hypothetical protein
MSGPLGVRLLLIAAATLTPAVTDGAASVNRLDGTQIAQTVLTERMATAWDGAC